MIFGSAPDWCLRYIGITYTAGGRTIEEGLDCFGLVSLVLKQQFNISMPNYAGSINNYNDKQEIQNRFLEGQCSFKKVDIGKENQADIIIFMMGGLQAHCGIIVGNGLMLHTEKKCLSSLDNYNNNMRWQKRISQIVRPIISL